MLGLIYLLGLAITDIGYLKVSVYHSKAAKQKDYE